MSYSSYPAYPYPSYPAYPAYPYPSTPDTTMTPATPPTPTPYPLIVSATWGVIVVRLGTEEQIFRDCRLQPVPTGTIASWSYTATEWNWKDDGTRHEPGITREAIKSLVYTCDYIILSCGMHSALNVKADTIKALQEACVSYEILPTPEAVEAYNRLSARGVQVGGLFHSTC